MNAEKCDRSAGYDRGKDICLGDMGNTERHISLGEANTITQKQKDDQKEMVCKGVELKLWRHFVNVWTSNVRNGTFNTRGARPHSMYLTVMTRHDAVNGSPRNKNKHICPLQRLPVPGFKMPPLHCLVQRHQPCTMPNDPAIIRDLPASASALRMRGTFP